MQDKKDLSAVALSDERQLTMQMILTGLSTQARVVNALILRETKTRYGNHKLGFLWVFLEPLIGISIFVTIFSNLKSEAPNGMPMVAFMLVGFVCFGVFRNPWNAMQGTISSSRSLLVFPQVSTFDVIIARGILELLVTFFVLIFLLYMAYLLGFEVKCERPLGVLMVCGLLALQGFGMGFLLASLEPLVPSIKQVVNQVFNRPLYFGSGLFFTVDTLPETIRNYLLYNPILHCIELLRGEFFYQYETAYGSWEYAGMWSLSTMAVGLLAHQAMQKRAIITK